jgi:coatomer protein complex subunit alpha (xenin)
MTAKSHGLTEECESILEATGLTEEQISLPAIGAPLSIPRAIVSTHRANWPTKATSQSFFEKALLGQVEGLSLEDEPASMANGFGFDDANEEDGSASKQNGNLIEAEDDEDAAGWDMGDDIVPEVETDFVNVDSPEAGVGSSEAELWARNSPLAADHIAGGSFETAMQLLNRQVGAVNFAPLKPRFMTIYEASRTYLPASSGLPPLINYVRRTVDETDPQKLLPVIPHDLESIASTDLQKGYDAVRNNKLEEGAVIFQKMLHSLLVNAVSNASEVGEVKKLITSAAEYSVAIAIELSRRRLGANEEVAKSPEKLKRSLELSAYFTIPKLEIPHRQLALMSALKLAYGNKNLSSALSFANRIMANGGGPKVLEQVSGLYIHLGAPGTNNYRIRPRRSRLHASVIPTTPMILNLISLLSLTSALRHTLLSMVAAHSRLVPMMEVNFRPNSKELSVLSVKYARLGRMEVA